MKKVTCFVLLLVLLNTMFSPEHCNGQCTNCNANNPTGLFSTINSNLAIVSSHVHGGDYSYYYVEMGNVYTWETCYGTSFDTQLTLFQGSACGTGVLAYNDDGCNVQSTITWTATFSGNVTLLVSKYNCANDTSIATIRWACESCGVNPVYCGDSLSCAFTTPASDFCSSATSVPSLNGICGITDSSYTPGDVPSQFCGSVENNSWYSFVAQDTSYSEAVYVCNCLYDWGIQTQVYSTTDCIYFTEYSLCSNPGGMTNDILKITGLTIGQEYFLMIDGFAGDVCEFRIGTGCFGLQANALISETMDDSVHICMGDTVHLQATGSASYRWSPASGLSDSTLANPSASPSSSTWYYCNAFSGSALCPNAVDSVFIAVSPSIGISSTLSHNPCYNDSLGAVSLNAPPGQYTVLWSTGDTTLGISGLPEGFYHVLVTDTNGACFNHTYEILSPPSPIVTELITTATCYGVCDQAIDASDVTNVFVPLAYQWSSGQTTSLISGLCAGDYYLTITDFHGCRVKDSFHLVLTLPLTIDTMEVTGDCNSSCNASCSIGISGPGLPYLVDWGGGLVANPAVGLCAGDYVVTVSNQQGCTVSDTVVIHPVVSGLTLAVTYIDSLSCANPCSGQVNIAASGAPGPYLYEWDTFQDSSGSIILCPGSYVISVTDALGCLQTTNVSVSGYLPLIINAGQDTMICSEEMAILSGYSNYPGAYWEGGYVNGQAFMPAQPEFYTFSTQDSCGNYVKDSVFVGIFPQTIANAGPDLLYCSNGTIVLSATGGISYSWSHGVLQDVPFIPAIEGYYSVLVTDSNGCSDMDSLFIELSQPYADAGNDTTICSGEVFNTTGVGGDSFEWIPALPFIPAVSQYCVYVAHYSNGCDGYDSLFVTVNVTPSLPVISFHADTLFSSASSGNQWYLNGILIPGETSPFIVPQTTGFYSLTVTESGCTSDMTSLIYVIISDVYNTNDNRFRVFPNPANDFVEIEWPESEGILSIYSADGRMVFQSPADRNKMTVDISHLSAGCYLLVLSSDRFLGKARLTKY